MSKRFGYVRKKPNFHNMSRKKLLRYIEVARGSHEDQDWVEEAYEWLRIKGEENIVVESNVQDSKFKGVKGRNF